MKLFVPLLAAVALALQPLPAAAFGGPTNVVMAVNRVDGRVEIQGRLMVHRQPGMIAAPLNFAYASGQSCVGCKTLAVALQLNFADTEANFISPQNVAVASNIDCDLCSTIALAFQVFFTVEDPTTIPPGVHEVMRDLDAELRAVSTDPNISLAQAEARIVNAIQRFWAVATAIDQQRSASE